MALVHRRSRAGHKDGDHTLSTGKKAEDNKDGSSVKTIAIISLVFVIFFGLTLVVSPSANHKSSATADNSGEWKTLKFGIPGQASAISILSRVNRSADFVTLGPHRVVVTIHNQTCKEPIYGVRLVGECLVHVHLVENAEAGTWSGNFSLPISGSYEFDFRWYGCNGLENEIGQKSNSRDSTVFQAFDAQNTSSKHMLSNELFPKSCWKTKTDGTGGREFVDPYNSGRTVLKTSQASAAQESVATAEKGFYEFKQLSNYELLCFVGNATMSKVRNEFLELRPQIAPSQRPFKFHKYDLSGDLLHPDRHWPETEKKRFRKCKHMLVHLEELESQISQREYRDRIVQFTSHLLRLMNDTTFPIRLLTWMEPPPKATSCVERFLARTTEHPCNDVLHELFRGPNRPFPTRVKLLDNTDITMPLVGEEKDVGSITNVALRIFSIAGQQVSDWRAAGQVGKVDGLHRGKTIEPNFELQPYNDWHQPIEKY